MTYASRCRALLVFQGYYEHLGHFFWLRLDLINPVSVLASDAAAAAASQSEERLINSPPSFPLHGWIFHSPLFLFNCCLDATFYCTLSIWSTAAWQREGKPLDVRAYVQSTVTNNHFLWTTCVIQLWVVMSFFCVICVLLYVSVAGTIRTDGCLVTLNVLGRWTSSLFSVSKIISLQFKSKKSFSLKLFSFVFTQISNQAFYLTLSAF